MEKIIIPLVLVGIFIVVVLLIGMSRRMAEKRRQAMSAAAAQLGLDFEEKPPDSLVGRLSALKLFSTGHARKAANLLHGESAMIEMAVFDYRYTVGSGRNSATYLQTPVCFFVPGLVLPQFRLAPENFFHRIGQAFGAKDFDFNSHPHFSRSYVLQGEDEEAVRDLFAPEVLNFFESNLNLNVEADGGILVFYRHGKRAKPAQVTAEIEFAKKVFAVLAPHAQRAEE